MADPRDLTTRPPDPSRQPLADQRAASGSLEAAASALLRRVPEPEELDESRLARIARRLDDAGEASPPLFRPLTFALGAAFSAAVMALWFGWWPSAPEVWRVPERSVVKLLKEGHVTYILVGPAHASVAPGAFDGSLRLESGRVVARAGNGPLRIVTPRGAVVVRQGATAEVVLEKAQVVIAAFDAQVVLEPERARPFGLSLRRAASKPEEIQPGQALIVTDGGMLRREAAQPSTCAVEVAGQVPELACSPVHERNGTAPVPQATDQHAPAPREAAPPADAGQRVLGPEPPTAAGPTAPDEPPRVAPAPPAPIERPAARRRARRVDGAVAGRPAPTAPASPGSTPASTAAPRDGGATPDAAASETGPLVAESRLLTRALQELRTRRDGQKALDLLDEHARRFPGGMLAQESKLARIDALLLLGRRRQVLEAIDKAPLARWPRGRELLVLRAELRAEAGGCDAAQPDFTAALRGDAGSLEERALYGRAACRARRGDPLGAQADFRDYLRRFPGGRYAAAVRRALGQP